MIQIELAGTPYRLANTFGAARKVTDAMDILRGRRTPTTTWDFYEELGRLLQIAYREQCRLDGTDADTERFMSDFENTDVAHLLTLVEALRKIG